MVSLIKEYSPSGTVLREHVVVGSVAFYPLRDFPWQSVHGCVVQFFATKHQAVEFARTGVVPDEEV